MYLKTIFLLLLCINGLGKVTANEQVETSETERPYVELEGPSSTPAALFVQEVLEQAYDKIGYDTTKV